jgi:hypothetical protein
MLKRLIILLLLGTYFLFGDSFISELCRLTEMPPQSWVQSGDRWTFQDVAEEKRSDILAIFEEMGWFEVKYASKKHYDYAVVLGALHASVIKRITHLVDTYNQGVRFDMVVFLTGQRPLHPEKESSFKGMEIDMMLEVWNTFPLPKEVRALPLIIVDAPPIPGRERPTTESTLYAWLDMAPKEGSSLFFSSQPFVNYQDAIIKQVLPSSFKVETIGPEGGKKLPIAVLLDTAAKWMEWNSSREK